MSPIRPEEVLSGAAPLRSLSDVVEHINAQLRGGWRPQPARWFRDRFRHVTLNLPRGEDYPALVERCGADASINGGCWPDAILHRLAEVYRAAGWGVSWTSGDPSLVFYLNPEEAP